MDKPDRVAVGQWWTTPGSEPWRIEAGHPLDGCEWLLGLGDAEYLGSGSNPEPSEWMIETLATLSARMIEEKRGGDPPGSFYLNADEEQRESVRGTIRWYLDDKSVDHWAYPNEARVAKAGIREVYRVLRSLGKW